MQCLRPIKTGYSNELAKSGFGYSITFSQKEFNRELSGWSIPCRKCLPCRLNQAREKAIRCYHESKMHPDNIFLTLTYDDEHLESPKLIYEHFQTFMKRLRRETDQKIPLMVTGEYGDEKKRPHWHALLFNYRPHDEKHKYTSDRGDKVSSSQFLTDLWGKGTIEYGELTIDSANYVARYAAKKLAHGDDQSHDYHPIHKTSSKYAIGKSWIEKNFRHTFENGFVVLPNGQRSKIPRYYVDWVQKHKPDLYLYYVTQVLPKIKLQAEELSEAERNYHAEQIEAAYKLSPEGLKPKLRPLTRTQVKEIILEQKFKKLQEKLKL